jgi:N-acyl-D-aspartate/D-glutamate deacylase
LILVLLGRINSSLQAQQPPYSVIIRGGIVIDGSGEERQSTDVGIRAGRIVALGDLKNAKADRIIDAKNRIVCPGFIDLHNHADRAILSYRAAENYIRQGVTTLVCGNCGGSPTDIGKLFKELRKKGTGPNIAMLVGHGSVREKVMGRINAAPSLQQLNEMRRLVSQAMKDGAIGLSTSLRYGAGTYATTDEIVTLVKEIAPYGGFYATHMRDEGTRILEAVEEALLIGEKANVPVHISHHKISSASVFGLTRQTLARIDQARKSGRDVTLDQYPYGAGSGNMNLYVPQWSLSGGLDEFKKRLTDPATKKRILDGVEELLIRKVYEADQKPDGSTNTAQALHRIRVARAAHDVSIEGQTITDILRARNKPVTLKNGCELLVELIAKNTRGINHTLEERPGGDVDRVMQHPQTCVASDGAVFEFGVGNPHPRSYGCYPRVLGHYVRERKLLTLEQAIHKMTVLPARRLGWNKRGRIQVGCIADIVVFDPKTIADRATFAKPHQHSVGVEHVLVRGVFVLDDAKLTEHRPGRPVSLNDEPAELRAWLTRPQNWKRDTDGPIVSLGKKGQFDDTHIFAPMVSLEQKKYRLWHCGSTGNVANRVFKMGLSTSADGRTFVRHKTNPVYEFGDGKHSVLTPTLLRNPDGSTLRENGKLRMWFSSTWFSGGNGLHTLHEATSADGITWSQPSAVLLDNVYAPTIIKDSDAFRMWFIDVGGPAWVIKHASSSDGVRWEVTAKPVISVDQDWERSRLFYPTVIKTGATYQMWYGSYWSARSSTTALGFAVSNDGLTWHKHHANPVLRPDPKRPWESNYVTSQSVMRLPDGSLRIWYASRKKPPFVNKYFAINTAVWQVE